jgi:hypothetical protein
MKKWFWLLSVFFLLGCELNGTDTGNPPVNTEAPPMFGNNPDGVLSDTATYQIISAACTKLAACESSAVYSTCMSSNGGSTLFAPALSTNTNLQLLTLAQLLSKELNSELTVDGMAAQDCVEDLGGLTCTEVSTADAFDALAASPYANLPNLFSDSCSTVFN